MLIVKLISGQVCLFFNKIRSADNLSLEYVTTLVDTVNIYILLYYLPAVDVT